MEGKGDHLPPLPLSGAGLPDEDGSLHYSTAPNDG